MPRKTGKIKSNHTILIVTEGHTEKIYFSQMKSFERFTEITIIPRTAKHSSVEEILETAIEESKSGVYDSIWSVFDRDKMSAEGKSDNLKLKIKAAEKSGVKFADSLPSFEIWFLLHYSMPKKHYSNQDLLIKELKNYIKNYEKNKEWLERNNLYRTLRPLLEKAIENSKFLESRNSEDSEQNSSSMTNVYKIFEELRTFLEK